MKTYDYFRLFLAIVISAVFVNTYAQEPTMYKLVGFASVGDGTTGGAGGDTVTVTTGTELDNALSAKKDSETPLVIIVDGLINEANSPGLSKFEIKDMDDVTILGKGEGAEFNGIGIKIRRASNIIIRNIKVHHVLTGDKDCISIEGPADHIWVDHCELYNEYQGVDKDYYDGLLDAKADCEYLTYSWNFLHDSWKTALVGSSESDTFDRKLTMHHNYFLNCNSRLPLFRGSTGHFFNNYYKDIASTAINSRINACVLIENNYFENAQNPWVSAYSDVLGGGDPVGNILVNSPFVYSDNTHELPYCSPSLPYEYSEVLHNADDVPDLVMNFAGVGKLDIGDTPIYTLTTNTTGSGSVTVEPDKAFYDSLEVITITAVPDADYEFDSWSGDASGSDNPLTITMDDFKSITALFTTDKLSLEYNTSGPGSVSADPDLSLYDPGSTVTLTATPFEGAYFYEWNGDASGNDNPLEIQLNENSSVTAVFKYEATDALEIQFEEAYCSLNGSTETNHDGYTGSGFIDLENESGSNISIAIEASESLVCTMEVRYSHGKTDDRSMKVNVNEATQVETLDFTPTASFDDWSTVSFEVTLARGNNIIEWVALTSNGGPNLDKVTAISTASALTPGLCDNEPEIILAPGSLQATMVSKNQIDLTWTDNSDNESGFIIERMEQGGTFTELPAIAQNTTSYSDKQLIPATTYTYRIKAYGDAGLSSWSSTASATTDTDISSRENTVLNKISVYPNPAKNELFIESEEVIYSVDIYSIDGKLLLSKNAFNENNIVLSLDFLDSGIYFYKVEAGTNLSTGMFLKE